MPMTWSDGKNNKNRHTRGTSRIRTSQTAKIGGLPKGRSKKEKGRQVERKGPQHVYVERGRSVVERRTRNQVSPGSNPALLPFQSLGIFVLSMDAPVDSAV